MDDATEERKKLEERREARRRRILQNADNRLKLITGSSGEVTSKPFETDSVNHILNEEIVGIEETNSGCVLSGNSHNEQIEAIIDRVESKQNVEERTYVPFIFDNYNILLVITSILTNIFSKIGFNIYFNESVFMPFFLLEIISIFFRYDGKPTSMLQTILLLSNLNPTIVQSSVLVMNKLEIFVKHFSIYFFTFMMFNIFLEIFV